MPTPPATPSLPRPEHGVRPARPTGYDLSASARFGSSLEITSASRGPAAAVFYVTEAGGAPQTFTAAAHTHLSGTWAADADVTAHGPDGFLRRFRGAGVDATVRQGRLTLANPSRGRPG
ncbi:phospholipase domain-containing protein [Actinoplanes sp. CA-030573]|uniref:phospholipase domain-containing protein n=1 Tax=Actinoplanes sp. CA-030573 TaxID=3239898 RepID=UPI003D94CE75